MWKLNFCHIPLSIFSSFQVLGIYTFTKRCNVEEYEAKPRKTLGYSTVTHFNVVHVDCHMAAVRY